MTHEELNELLNFIQKTKCETQTLEIKSATRECPKRLYDTLSSFANQEAGGTIIFGISEENNFEEVGVYDPHDIQKKINEQCLQMEPIIRPLLTVTEREEKFIVSAEIPGLDISERPCFYKGKGRIKGSYIRVGDSDEPMTEYEVYSFDAFRKKYQDDIRVMPRVSFASLDQVKLEEYILKLKSGKQRLATLRDENICELMSITRNHDVTLSATMLFSPYPQAYAPQLCINAISVPGIEKGELGEDGERFIDNERIEGTIPEMLNSALTFVKKNMKTKVIVDGETGRRIDKTEYPIAAVREAILNALVHRDYSSYTDGMPITIDMYEDRMEISNPGGLYGRIHIDQLGKTKPDTRNPVIATALEIMGITENRYSGIPTIRSELRKYNLPEPVFTDYRGHFTIVFHKSKDSVEKGINHIQKENDDISIMRKGRQLCDVEDAILEFCKVPKSREEIAKFLKLTSKSYAIKTYIRPLVEIGKLRMTHPEKPGSHKQRYFTPSEGMNSED